MVILHLARLLLLVTSTLFSFITLGILCNFTSITTSEGFYYHSFALGIATSLFTIIGVIAFLVIEKVRKGAVVSLIWFELLWTGFLWILWLATAASITSLGVFTSCGYFNSVVESTCRQYQAVQAFSWLNWLMIFGWFVTLLVLSFISQSRGNSRIWFTGTTDAEFLKSVNTGKVEYTQGVTPQYTGYTGTTATPHQQYGGYDPQQQQQYTGGAQQYPGSPVPQQLTGQGYPEQTYPQPQQGYTQQGYPQNYGQA